MRFSRHRRGNSLVEIAIAIAVISIGVLGVFGSVSYSLRSVDHARYASESLNIARQVVEDVQAYNLAPWSNNAWPTTPGGDGGASGLFDDVTADYTVADPPAHAINDAPFGDLAASPTYRRVVRLQRVSTDPSSPLYTVALMIVRVYWQEKGVERYNELRAEYRQP